MHSKVPRLSSGHLFNFYLNMRLLNIIFFLFSLALQAQDKAGLEEVSDFGSNPGNLKMFVHVPEKKSAAARPLVVALHGCSQSAKEIARLSGWNKLADINDFIVLYPQQRLANNPSSCFDWFLERDVSKGSGESESVYQMIQKIRGDYAIDSTNIFITGLSAGAGMTVVLMATHPELFKAGAVFAGPAYKLLTDPASALQISNGKTKLTRDELIDRVKEQNPDYKGKYPKMIIFQGTKDPIVHPNNAKYLVWQWSGLLNCDTVPAKSEQSFEGHAEISRFEYQDKETQKPVMVFYQGKGIGHQLMVNPGDKDDEGGETGIFAVDKDFHATYQAALEFGLIKKKK